MIMRLCFARSERRTHHGLRAKNREQADAGNFTAVFLIQCLEAIGTS